MSFLILDRLEKCVNHRQRECKKKLIITLQKNCFKRKLCCLLEMLYSIFLVHILNV